MKGTFPGTHSLGPNVRLVNVSAITGDGTTAICTDRKGFEVRVPLYWQRAKGVLPEVGEDWLVSQDVGQWTFLLYLGSGPADTIQLLAPGVLGVTGSDFAVDTAGEGLQVKEGTNAKQGTALLASGVAVVANTSVTATSRIFLTSQVDGGTPGWLRVSARTAGTSFTITSSSNTDASTVAYEIFEAAP